MRLALGALTLAYASGFGASTTFAQGRAPAKRNAPAPRAESKAKKRPPGVRGMFEVAQELYEAGKFTQALAAYDLLLRKYPSHEPAVIQTAKTLYRLDRIKEAYNVFSRINPQHLDPETSYEYGWSFYTFKAYDGAFLAFQRVPRGHALYDLANYYGAICAIKLKKYEDAEDMLEKAVVLPDKLAKSRSLYIKHVQALRLMQQRSSLAKERDKEKDALDADGKKKTPKSTDVGPPESTEYQHQGFKSVDKSAKVTYQVVHQYLENHGFKETHFDAKVSSFELLSGTILAIPLKFGKNSEGKDRQGAVGLQLRIAAEDRITEGNEERLIVDETEDDLQRLLAKNLGITDVKSGDLGFEPWIELPLPEGLWMNLGGEISFTYPDFERGKRFGYRKGYGGVDGHTGALTYGGALNYTELLDEKTKVISNAVEGRLRAETEIVPKLVGTVTLIHSVFDYLNEELALDGPDTSTRFEAQAVQVLPLTFKFTLFGAFEQDANYIFHGIPTFGQVAADGNVTVAKAKLSVSPFPFISASVQEIISQSKWSIDNEAARDPFEVNVSDYIEAFSATVTLNMDF